MGEEQAMIVINDFCMKNCVNSNFLPPHTCVRVYVSVCVAFTKTTKLTSPFHVVATTTATAKRTFSESTPPQYYLFQIDVREREREEENYMVAIVREKGEDRETDRDLQREKSMVAIV